MNITFDSQNQSDRTFCEWLTRHEQTEPLYFELQLGAEITDKTRIACLAALPEFRGWAKLLAAPGLQGFAKKVCTHLAAGRDTLPQRLFRHSRTEIAETLRKLPPRPAAAIH